MILYIDMSKGWYSGYFGLNQWLSTKGQFCALEDIWQCLETFLVVTAQGWEALLQCHLGMQHNEGFSGPKAKVSSPRFNGITKHVANTYLLRACFWLLNVNEIGFVVPFMERFAFKFTLRGDFFFFFFFLVFCFIGWSQPELPKFMPSLPMGSSLDQLFPE